MAEPIDRSPAATGRVAAREDRRPTRPGRSRPGSRASISPIAAVLALGLAFRLILAYVVLPGSGFENDLNVFTSWALGMAEHGPGEFYGQTGFADYPPAYLFVLWAVGAISQALDGVLRIGASEIAHVIIKIPPILADLGIGWLLYRLARDWFRDRPDPEGLALGAAAIYLANPVTWYDSAVWGQVDSVGALVMLLALALLVSGHSEGASAATVLAGLVKPQFGIVLAPVVGIVLLRRHLFRPGTGPRPFRVPEALRGWLVDEQGPWRIVSAATVGLITMALLIFPFGLDLPGFIARMIDTAGGYPNLSVNAYNPWALLGAGGQEPLAAGGGWSPDDEPLFGPIPGVVVGSALLGLSFLWALWNLARREGRGMILIALIYLSIAFFVLPTRVHERYLFPAFAFLPLIAVVDRRWWLATAVLTAASFINLHGVLTTPIYASPNLDDFFPGEAFRSFIWITISVLGHVAVFLFVVVRWRRGDAALVEPMSSPAGGPEPAEAATLPTPTTSAVSAAAATEPVPAPETAWSEIIRPVRQRIRDRVIDLVPLRADRTAALAREPLGRPDRLDLLVIALVIIAALVLRTWRLEEPYEMHFDEVYHARTAAEFLQDWRYGIPHEIYEYTHPHLAKYLIAAGLVAAANDRVTGVADLGVPVAAADLEERWSPDGIPGDRHGDRLYVATGTEILAFDLARRERVATLPIAATRVAVDAEQHVLLAAEGDGHLLSLSTEALDPLRPSADGVPGDLPVPTDLGELGGRPADLLASSDGLTVLALLDDDRLIALDSSTGDRLAEATIEGGNALARGQPLPAAVIDPASVDDVTALADALAPALEADAGNLRERIEAASEPIVAAGALTEDQRTKVQELIDDEETPGVSIADRTTVGVATDAGVEIRDATSLETYASVPLDAPATGLDLVSEGDRPTLYTASGTNVARVEMREGEAPRLADEIPMPEQVESVRWNPASKLVHVLGRSADGEGWSIYVIEPNGNAVFADARLPFTPVTWVMDVQPDRPSADRQETLAIAADGRIAAVDVGSNAFAWRLPGVIAGALTAGLLYLLVRLLFRRRLVALILAVFVLADGMFFANARIAMNDAYVSLFIAAAATLFAALWLGHLRGPPAAVGVVGLGVLLGLAFASKWVGAYAIGAIVLLVLLRSGLGRLLALAGMVTMTAVLGTLAISARSDVEQPRQNLLFLILLMVLTLALAAASILRPLPVTVAQLRTLVRGALVGGSGLLALVLLFRQALPSEGMLSARPLLVLAGSMMVAGLGIAVGAALAGRYGVGPLAARAQGNDGDGVPTDAGADRQEPRWLDPGWRAGVPWLAVLFCLIVIPVLVYLASYIPWAQPWHAEGPRFAADWPIIGTWPPGHTGGTLIDLQASMYRYHDQLRATHAASSPWWAWPFDLKPVWFYSNGFANETSAYIYDSGNLVLFWLAIPAVAWTAWMAWRRRSRSLAFVLILLLGLWLPWARIDRATFQYHVFTSLPFTFMALAYLIAELWHGPSRGTWLLARVVGAVALVGPAVLWLARGPLCGLAGTELVREGSQACGGEISTPVGTFQPDAMVLLLLVPLVLLAWFILTARDSRRFAVVAVGLAIFWFVVWYPNLAAVPMPRVAGNLYQVFLPTYSYDFQFAVNTDEHFSVPLLRAESLLLLAFLAAATAAAMYAASAWRPVLESRGADPPAEPGS